MPQHTHARPLPSFTPCQPGRHRIRAAALAVSLAIVTGASPAPADDGTWRTPKPSYLWDGGAVPFFWLPLGLTLSLKTFSEPPPEPVMFSRMEGGKSYTGGQFPTSLLYVNSVVAGGMILLGGDDSRLHHAKGFAQGVMMTAMLTTIAKDTFGRQRPMHDLARSDMVPDTRRSFWSGHSSSTLATATYLGLYARQHLFNRWRPAGTFTWWEGAAYTGLAAAAIAIPYSQYKLHRHHASDVITGSLVGIGVSTLFYVYQERRYRKDKEQGGEVSKPEPFSIAVTPSSDFRGITFSGTF